MLNYSLSQIALNGSGRFSLESFIALQEELMSELDVDNLREYNADLEIEKEILLHPSGKTPARIEDENDSD